MPVALPSQLWKPKMSPNTTKCPWGTQEPLFKEINTEKFSGKGTHLPVILKWRRENTHIHIHAKAQNEKQTGQRIKNRWVWIWSEGYAGVLSSSSLRVVLRPTWLSLRLWEVMLRLYYCCCFLFTHLLQVKFLKRKFFQKLHDMWYYTWNVIIFRKPT